MTSNTYLPLNPLRREIRLARLHPKTRGPYDEPVDRNAEINLSIITASLNGTTEYSALSYAWDEAKDTVGAGMFRHLLGEAASDDASDCTVEITVDGHPFPVTRNLAAALDQLSPADDEGDITLWIDAICIQQSNPNEKTSQIRLLREIYENATKNIVWLGEDADHAGEIMRAFSYLKWGAESWDLSTMQCPDFTDWLLSNCPPLHPLGLARGQTALKTLLGRKY